MGFPGWLGTVKKETDPGLDATPLTAISHYCKTHSIWLALRQQAGWLATAAASQEG